MSFELIKAVENGDYKKISELLKNGADIEYQMSMAEKISREENILYSTPLKRAIGNRDAKMLEFLIRQGANINGKNGDVPPLLRLALDYSQLYAMAERGKVLFLFNRLLANGANLWAHAGNPQSNESIVGTLLNRFSPLTVTVFYEALVRADAKLINFLLDKESLITTKLSVEEFKDHLFQGFRQLNEFEIDNALTLIDNLNRKNILTKEIAKAFREMIIDSQSGYSPVPSSEAALHKQIKYLTEENKRIHQQLDYYGKTIKEMDERLKKIEPKSVHKHWYSLHR